MHEPWGFLLGITMLIVIAFPFIWVGAGREAARTRARLEAQRKQEKVMFQDDVSKLTDKEIAVQSKSLREWLASWGNGPNWSDNTGITVPMVKVSITGMLDALDRITKERDEWKKRAAQHGCNIEEGDHECG